MGHINEQKGKNERNNIDLKSMHAQKHTRTDHRAERGERGGGGGD